VGASFQLQITQVASVNGVQDLLLSEQLWASVGSMAWFDVCVLVCGCGIKGLIDCSVLDLQCAGVGPAGACLVCLVWWHTYIVGRRCGSIASVQGPELECLAEPAASIWSGFLPAWLHARAHLWVVLCSASKTLRGGVEHLPGTQTLFGTVWPCSC
jgi:hypothetical protein